MQKPRQETSPALALFICIYILFTDFICLISFPKNGQIV